MIKTLTWPYTLWHFYPLDGKTKNKTKNYSRGFISYIYRYFCWIVYLEIGWWKTLCSWNFRMLFTYNVVCWDSSSTIFGICGTCGVVLGSGFQGSCPEERPCPPGVGLVLAVVCTHSLPAQQCSTQTLPQLPLTTYWNPGPAPEPLTLRCLQATLSFASNAGSVKTDLYLYSFCALRGKFYELKADWQSPMCVQ